MLKKFRQLDIFLDRHVPCLLIFVLVLVLRIPGLAEPYWYGDEAIYLTIGQAMRHGERLYLQIVDHKTPIIYYLAMVGTQFWFRILMIISMLVAAGVFYWLTRKIFKSFWVALISTLFF